MKVIRLNKTDGTRFRSQPKSTGGQAHTGSGENLKPAEPSALLNGVRNKLCEDVCESLGDEELEFCITSLSAIWDVLNRHKASQSRGQSGASQALNGKDNDFMKKLEHIVESVHTDPDLGLEQLATRMAMSGRHLQRKLKSIADQKPVEYLRAYRLRKARKLLETGQLVSQVADAVGFSSPAYFTSCFKACFGLTPSEFQQLTR